MVNKFNSNPDKNQFNPDINQKFYFQLYFPCKNNLKLIIKFKNNIMH